MMLDDLFRRIYNADPNIHQAALAEILRDPDPAAALETLLELLERSASDPYKPTPPYSLPEVEAQLKQFSEMLLREQPLEDLMNMSAQVEAFRSSFREQKDVMLELRRAVASLGRSAWTKMMDLARGDPPRYVDQIHTVMLDFEGTATLDDILTTLEHPQTRIRQRAAYMLAEFDDPRVVPALVNLLHTAADRSGAFDTREVAARALAKCGKAGAEALLEASSDPTLRDYAVTGLMHSGDSRALDTAIEWMLSADEKKRLSGLGGVDRMLDAAAVDDQQRILDALVQRIRQGNENMFSPASKVIAKLGGAAVEPMLALVSDAAANDDAHVYALDALWRVYQSQPESLGGRFPDLLRSLLTQRENPKLAGFAARIVAQLPQEASLDALMAAAQTYREDHDTLTSIVYALGQQHDARALPLLRDLLQAWQAKPRGFEVSEVIDEINGAINSIERKGK